MSELPLPRGAGPNEVLEAALDRCERGAPVVIATVLRRHGSAPSTPGQKLALLAPDEAVGSIGGGAVERCVLTTMRDILARGPCEPRLERYDLGPRVGMCCGGGVELVLERLEPALRIVLVGAGHIGVALAPLCASLGFRVFVCDPREGALEEPRLAARARLEKLALDHDDPAVASALGSVRASDAALVMTHDHQLDQAAIEWALRAGFGLVGGVGSRAKAARTRARLEAKGFLAGDVARVQMPLGLAIGARSPQEIAVAIAGELVRWRAERLAPSRNAPRAHDHDDVPLLGVLGRGEA